MKEIKIYIIFYIEFGDIKNFYVHKLIRFPQQISVVNKMMINPIFYVRKPKNKRVYDKPDFTANEIAE